MTRYNYFFGEHKADAPLTAEPIVAFRTFKVTPDGELISPYQNVKWEPNAEVKATCRIAKLQPPGFRHKVPDADCGCGLHGYFEPNFLYGAGNVLAIVQMWGAAQAHATGIRTEYGKVVALVKLGGEVHYRNNQLVTWAAKKLKLPVIDQSNARTAANEFGTLVTSAMVDQWVHADHEAIAQQSSRAKWEFFAWVSADVALLCENLFHVIGPASALIAVPSLIVYLWSPSKAMKAFRKWRIGR